MKCELFADGACQPNPGIGGWAFIINYGDTLQHFDSGAQENTTNNQMELISILNGLKWIYATFDQVANMEHLVIFITSDSQYAVNGLSKWCVNWSKRGWIKKDKKPVLNKELWISLMEVISSLKKHNIAINYQHIRGHSGHPQNEQCDKMAVQAIKNLRKNHV